MALVSDLRRLKRIAWRDRLLLAETTAMLAAASLAIKLVPFRKVMGTLAPASPGRSPADSPAEVARVRWAVEACARRLPWRIVCFQKGLATQRLLRRRGVETALHYGVAQDGERGLHAHVWVTHQGRAIVGGDEAPGFTCLATFPAQPS